MSKLQARLLLLALFCGSLLAFPSSAAAGRVQCGAVKSTILKRAVRYCVLLPPSYDTEKTRRYPALYYLHGLFENEQSLVNFGGWNMVEDLQGKGRIGEFLIITPNGGRGFYINSKDGRERYEDFFIREFIPAIDRTFRTQAARAARSIGGSSMGGYGALRFAFKYPQLFSAVGVHQAALVENPSKGLTATVAPFLGRVTVAFGSPPDPAFWDAQSPFTLARGLANSARLKIYFDCGTEDEYGFHIGAKALHELLESRKVPHEFQLFPGAHGWLYVADHLQDSLEFHSRALGLTGTK
jgi:S-formylglutathione hydrolase FrmB